MQLDRNVALNIVTAAVAVIACIASVRSCDIAKEALKTSSAQFVAEKRPYLVVVPYKFKKSNKYIEVDKIKDGRVRLHIQLKIENIGNVAAIEI